MLLPVEWLGEFIELRESNEEISHQLTMCGLEIEGAESSGADQIFEVNITPNRPDCLSVLGVARELRAITGRNLKLPDITVESAGACPVRVIIDSPLCRRYAGRAITGIRLGESPDWIKKRLENAGIRSINNVVDVTNYVLLEFGHPLHAFDMDTLHDATIRVDTMNSSSTFRTLDGIERRIPPEALMIWDGKHPVAIAGVMGGLETEVTDRTVNIFLESAWFEPASIRKTSRKLGLKTESSYRFERGTDIEGLIAALDRAASLIKELCGGSVSEKIDVYPSPYQPPQVELRFERVGRVLGKEIPPDEIKGIIMSLGFSLRDESSTGLLVEIPSFRVDVSTEIDLIEEVARHYGYDRIPASIPSAPVGNTISSERERIQRLSVITLRHLMEDSGFSEAINYSFMNPASLDQLMIPEDDPRRNFVQIKNPLTVEDSAMRTMLMPSLIRNAILNIRQGLPTARLFEISKVFLRENDKLPDERLHLGGIFYSTPGQSLWEEKTAPFFILKGLIEKALLLLRREEGAFVPTGETFLHPGKSADLMVSGTRIGSMGILSPEVLENLEIKDFRVEIGVFEIDLTSLMETPVKETAYSSIPRFPSTRRDIALLIGKDQPAGFVLELIGKFGADLVEDCWIFDLYEGKNIPEGMKSLGISITYRAEDRTLTDEEVDTLHQKITGYLIEKTGGKLRG